MQSRWVSGSGQVKWFTIPYHTIVSVAKCLWRRFLQVLPSANRVKNVRRDDAAYKEAAAAQTGCWISKAACWIYCLMYSLTHLTFVQFISMPRTSANFVFNLPTRSLWVSVCVCVYGSYVQIICSPCVGHIRALYTQSKFQSLFCLHLIYHIHLCIYGTYMIKTNNWIALSLYFCYLFNYYRCILFTIR